MTDFEKNDFSGIKISLASADDIRGWSSGEVKKPETINYRTLKPEKDGLFCEKIFGPTKDWECSCGKYKGIRFKGITCERCGVEVTSAKVRRERMGHIELAAPVSHIWYFKGASSSPMAILLDIKNKELEKVLYFASYIVTRIDEEAREEDAAVLKEELEADIEEMEAARSRQSEKIMALAHLDEDDDEYMSIEEASAEIIDVNEEFDDDIHLRRDAFDAFMTCYKNQLIGDEELFRSMRRYYGLYFDGGMGAEAIRDLLLGVNLDEIAVGLREEVETGKGQKRIKAIKRLELVSSFRKGGNDPADMILDVVPIIPPDLRPMVQLEGGRFAASDLNDLYRRVINRNNRLKRLLDLDAPSIIVNNEKRMLQESVDALFDNGRRGRPQTGHANRPLKSLAEALKGKQGRFRQNLLGKRVDYSGRSVIVVDPKLKLHQCGLPKTMALELFKPFVMKRLVELSYVENIKGAKRVIERGESFVWDVLEEVIEDHLVLLNRAPTLHRLSIQAFEPLLIEGKAIHLHPLVCSAFNADFDGDQMSVHVPLSNEAQAEARVLMLSSNNLRSPASGKPLTVPSQDMIIGMYYMTSIREGRLGEGRVFPDFAAVITAFDAHADLDLQAKITVRLSRDSQVKSSWGAIESLPAGTRIDTCVGRILFNAIFPDDYPFINYKITKSEVAKLTNDCCDRYPLSQVEPILDGLKSVGFHYATLSGLTVSVWDAEIPKEDKARLIKAADARVVQIEEDHDLGLMTLEERRRQIIELWNSTSEEVGEVMASKFTENNPIFMMADSGARGSLKQLRQLAGMRGLMSDINTKKVLNSKRPLAPNTDPRAMRVVGPDAIEMPIKANFREGLSTLEYFISTYGARKGLVDTASHTSDSGYLTRRLVDVAQDVIVRQADCGTTQGVWYDLINRKGDVEGDLVGRVFSENVISPKTGEIVAKAGCVIESVSGENPTPEAPSLDMLLAAGVERVYLRTVVTCHSRSGVCQKCYGWDLSTRRLVNIGTAVGVIAAQSIGEPGTQLTMRTIHTGGAAGGEDITQGLPYVSRMFNVVSVKNSKVVSGEAVLAPFNGVLSIESKGADVILTVTGKNTVTQKEDGKEVERFEAVSEIALERDLMVGITDGVEVKQGQQLSRGFIDFKQLRSLADTPTTMRMFVNSVKDVYVSQGVDLNDKHIEVIARQMLRRVRVTKVGASKFLLNQNVDRYDFEDEINRLTLEGVDDSLKPKATDVILSVVRATMSSDSWLSAASFERTAAVLTEAAIEGKIDHLNDLKANVIIGKIIPAGTGLNVYKNVPMTYDGKTVDQKASVNAPSLPEWAPDALRNLEEHLPSSLEWGTDGDYGYLAGARSHNGRTLSSEDAKLYLFDDLSVSQRWTNKFSEAGIETVGDLIGKTEDELLRIDGIGAKAIEELHDGLEARNLLYLLEPDEELLEEDDISALLEMVFSPDGGDDIMLGKSVPAIHHYDDELIGVPTETESNSQVINENLESLDELLSQAVRIGDSLDDDEDEENIEE